MFKLPQLQGTGTSSTHGRVPATDSRASSAELRSRVYDEDDSRVHGRVPTSYAPPMSIIEQKGWQDQAQDIMSDINSSSKYKSVSLHAEVKLAEALDRCRQLCPATLTEEGDEKPSKLQTAVCCQLLGECAELCGPFSSILRTIRDELVKSIYSSMYSSDRGAMAFHQLPYFVVVERLEHEKEVMLREREVFQQLLQEREKQLEGIEEHIEMLSRTADASETEVRRLRGQLASLQASSEAQQLETRTARDELKRLRKDNLRTTNQLDSLRKAHVTLQEESSEREKKLTMRAEQLSTRLHTVLEELGEAKQLAASRLDPEEVAELQVRLEHAEMDLGTVRLHEQELEAAVLRMGSMTPRPSWSQLRPYGDSPIGEESTAEIAQHLVRRGEQLATANAALKTDLQHAQALLAPDPVPSPLRLVIIQDKSKYFLTEGAGLEDDDDDDDKPVMVQVDGLGLSAAVPRWLRWKGRLQISNPGLQQLEATIHDTWQVHEQQQQRATPQTLATCLLMVILKAGGPAQEIAQRAYSILHGCQCHHQSSAAVRLFWKVLMGQLPESARDYQHNWQAEVARAVADLPAMDVPEQPGPHTSREGLLQLLSSALGPQPPAVLDELQNVVRAAFPDEHVPAGKAVSELHLSAAQPLARFLQDASVHKIEVLVDVACQKVQAAAAGSSTLSVQALREALAVAGASERSIHHLLCAAAAAANARLADLLEVKGAALISIIKRGVLLQPASPLQALQA